ncbi:MAG: hypothetical protein WD468_05995 [Pirellulales bacterium]
MVHLSKVFRVCAIACVLTVSATARAEVTYTQSDDELTVIRLTITPAAQPEPIFKYRFQPRYIDLQPGNAAPFYYRALAALTDNMARLRKKYSEEDDLYRWYGTAYAEVLPIDRLPLEMVRDAVEISTGGMVGDQLKLATTRRECVWDIGMEEVRGIDLVSIQLDEFQRSREISRMLAMRTRLAIAERRFNDAIDTIRMNFRVANDFSTVPFIVAGLIGIAEAGMTGGTVTELIAAPDSPNLYWALAELPQPFVDFRPAVRFEMEFGLRMFPFIQNAETTDRSPDEWNRLFTQAVRDLAALGGGNGIPAMANNDFGAGLAASAYALVGYPHVKSWLIEHGMDAAQIDAMPVGQAMAIYTERLYQKSADNSERLWYMPYWEMRKQRNTVEDELRDAGMFGINPDREVLPVVNTLLPALQAARNAQVRLERDLAALQVIEALRMFAAANNGRLPETLDAVTQVPIPLNPATGKPFVYRLDGNTAILDLPASDGIAAYIRRYEIQIAGNKPSAETK